MSTVHTPGVGARLREFRTRRGWSTRKLAAALGISQPMISYYERGLSKIDADFLPQMADVLGVQPGAFYGEEERPISVAELLRRLEEALRQQDQPVQEQPT
jgi:transcriptional regulator with XRE-family HTH domain